MNINILIQIIIAIVQTIIAVITLLSVILIYRTIIKENETKLYFKDFLVSVRKVFDSNLLFEKEVANKSEYKGIQ